MISLSMGISRHAARLGTGGLCERMPITNHATTMKINYFFSGPFVYQIPVTP
jgi:hypothetical protein